MQGAKSYHELMTLQGGIILFIVAAMNIFGIEVVHDEITMIVSSLLAVISGIMVVYGRIRAKYVLK